MKQKEISRRNFLGKSATGLGMGIVGSLGAQSCAIPTSDLEREIRRRTVKIASVDLQHLYPERSIKSRVNNMLERMEKAAGSKPDIMCLTETFDTSYVDEQKSYAEIAEDENNPGPVTSRVADFANK